MIAQKMRLIRQSFLQKLHSMTKSFFFCLSSFSGYTILYLLDTVETLQPQACYIFLVYKKHGSFITSGLYFVLTNWQRLKMCRVLAYKS